MLSVFLPPAFLNVLRRSALPLLLTLPILFGSALYRADAQPILLLPTTDLTLHTQNGQGVFAHVELATTPQSQAQGLMYRQRLPANQGMLFVFEQAAGCFWMRNTLIPLSIAFIDAAGVIGQINHMQPLSEAPHCPELVAPYALEMNVGWFERNGIKVGSRVSGLPALPDGSKP